MARSRFRQAEIFRNMGDYDSAAHIANIILGTKDFSSGEMNDYVNDRVRALTRFSEWKLQLQKIDSVEFLLHKVRHHGATILEGVRHEIRIEAERQVLGSRWQPDRVATLTAEEEKLVKQYEEKIQKEKASTGVSVFSINFSDTTKYIDSVHFVGAHAHFELGRAYENFIEYPSAIAEYKQAFEYIYMRPDTATNIFRAQVLFTWIELDHQLGNTTERDALIERLTRNFGESIYAQQAMKEYGGAREKDSPGEVAFTNAYAAFKSSGLESAKPGLLAIVSGHTHEDVAARALYTIGVAYEDKPRFDSALVYYRRVMFEYPYSKYAEFLKPKMLYAMQEASKKNNVKPVEIPKQTVTDPNQKNMQDSTKNPVNNQKLGPPNPKDQPQQPLPPRKN